MKKQASGIAFLIIGLCFLMIFNERPLGLAAAALFVIAGIVQIIRNRSAGH